MLTDNQVQLLMEFSFAVSSGLILGFLGAALASASIAILRRNHRDIEAVLRRCVIGIWLGMISSVLVAIAVTTITVAVFPRGFKGGRKVPDWLITTHLVLLLVCPVIVAVFMQSDWARSKSIVVKNRVTWCLLAALAGFILGGIAGVGGGFEGYFVVQSNSGPIEYALCGALFVATLAFLSARVTMDCGCGLKVRP